MGKLHDNGEIIWNEKKLSLMYFNATFENQTYLLWRYLPLCNGPCPQKVMELGDDNDFSKMCVKNLMEYSFEDSIIDLYEFIINNKKRA